MELHPKKRIEIIVAAPLRDRVCGLLEDLGVGGYTVTSAEAGRGHSGVWREGLPSDAMRQVVILCVTTPDRAEGILTALARMLRRHSGIVSVADVQVLRDDYF